MISLLIDKHLFKANKCFSIWNIIISILRSLIFLFIIIILYIDIISNKNIFLLCCLKKKKVFSLFLTFGYFLFCLIFFLNYYIKTQKWKKIYVDAINCNSPSPLVSHYYGQAREKEREKDTTLKTTRTYSSCQVFYFLSFPLECNRHESFVRICIW
jgi:hypothetical protein